VGLAALPEWKHLTLASAALWTELLPNLSNWCVILAFMSSANSTQKSAIGILIRAWKFSSAESSSCTSANMTASSRRASLSLETASMSDIGAAV
jgi:hypothetical protein